MASIHPRARTISEVKAHLLNPAQTSQFQVAIGIPQGGEFGSFLRQNSTNYRQDQLNLLCAEASLPGSQLATTELTGDFTGVTERHAYRRMYDGTLDLSFMVDRNYNVIEMLDGWLDFISGVGITGSRQSYKSRHVNYRMTYPEQYRTELYLTKFEKDVSYPDDFGDVIEGVLDPPKQLLYTFVGAFPSSVTSTPVSYGPSDVLRVNVSFSYMRYVRERKNVRLNPFGSLNSSLLTALGDFIF